MHDGEVATRRHGDGEPRGRRDERVDDGVAVSRVIQVKSARVELETKLVDPGVRDDGEAEEEIGDGEGNETWREKERACE